jgi:hypothetical protein
LGEAADTLDLSRLLNNHIAEVVRETQRNLRDRHNPLQDAILRRASWSAVWVNWACVASRLGTHVDANTIATDLIAGTSTIDHSISSGKQRSNWTRYFCSSVDMNVGSACRICCRACWHAGRDLVAICSMIFGGVFERFPSSASRFAHGGGAFPSTIGRIEHAFHVRPDPRRHQTTRQNPRSYLAHSKTPARFICRLDLLMIPTRLRLLLKTIWRTADRVWIGLSGFRWAKRTLPTHRVDEGAFSGRGKRNYFPETAREFPGL